MGKYVSYPTGTAFGALQAQWAEPVTAAPTTTTIRVRNNTGKIITLIGAQCVCTQTNAAGGTQLDIQNAAAQPHLTAPINMAAAAAGIPEVSAAFAGAGGATVANGVDVYFVLTNAGGGGNSILNGQATLFYTCEFAST